MIVPIGAFAIDNSKIGGCDIYMEFLNEKSQPQST
jgi:hypothetical protein